MVKREKRQQFTTIIADIPVRFDIEPEEELLYRDASYAVNDIWKKIRGNEPDDKVTLAKLALAFAELNYRREALLNKQHDMLDSFEKELDGILQKMK